MSEPIATHANLVIRYAKLAQDVLVGRVAGHGECHLPHHALYPLLVHIHCKNIVPEVVKGVGNARTEPAQTDDDDLLFHGSRGLGRVGILDEL